MAVQVPEEHPEAAEPYVRPWTASGQGVGVRLVATEICALTSKLVLTEALPEGTAPLAASLTVRLKLLYVPEVALTAAGAEHM